MLKLLFYLSLGFLIVSCNDLNQINSKSNELNIESKSSQKIFLSELVSQINYELLETTEINTIAYIDKLLIYQNRLYLFDSKTMKISLFDNKGNFINQKADIGRGPGEHLFITDFLIDSINNNIELLDNGNRKILKLDLNLNFKCERQMQYYVRNFSLLSNNLYAYLTDNYPNHNLFKSNSDNVFLLDSNNKFINSFMPIKDLKYLTGPAPNRFVKYGNGINFSTSYDTHIYYLTSDKCIEKYYINFGKNKVPYDLIKSYGKIDGNDRNSLAEAFSNIIKEINKNGYVPSIENIFENKFFLIFQYGLYTPGEKNGTYTVIYNKKTKRIYSGKPENDIDFGLFGDPLALIGDTLITYIHSNNLIEKIKSINTLNSSSKLNANFLKLQELTLSLSGFENPIIAKFLINKY
jgi:hypothetical protein